MAASKEELWDLLNAEYHQRKRVLHAELKKLDEWYEEEFVLHDLSSSSSERR